MRCMRILPELWARTSWPLSVLTRNVAFFNDSTTVPSSRIACSLALVLDSVLHLPGMCGPVPQRPSSSGTIRGQQQCTCRYPRPEVDRQVTAVELDRYCDGDDACHRGTEVRSSARP